MAVFFSVATPIGNLEDVTLRALRILGEADIILAEDTRVTAKLLLRAGIAKKPLRFDAHAREDRIQEVLGFLRQGKTVALVTDAGTPGIQDPGNYLVARIAKEVPETAIVPVPGASALTAIAQVAGIPMDAFFFAGFLPQKKGRQTMREKLLHLIIEDRVPVVLYESPHRIIKTLSEFAMPTVYAVVGRELTKKFETVYRGPLGDVIREITPRGEFAIILYVPRK